MRYWGICGWVLLLGLPWVALLRDWLRHRVANRQAQLLEQNRDAGREWARQRKWPEALSALDRALALVDRNPGLKSELQFHRGYVLEQMKRPEEAISAYVACQLAESNKMVPRYRHIAAFRQGYLLAQLERWQEAELSLRASIKEASRISLPGLQLNALRILLGVLHAARRYAEVLDCAQDASRLAYSLRDESMRALVLDMEGDAHLALRQWKEALHHYEQSLDLFRQLGNVDAEFVIKQDISRLYQACGEWDKAVRWLGVCLRDEERAQSREGQARLAYDLACLHIHKGELDKAGGYLQRSMGWFRQGEDSVGTDLVGRTMMGLSILMHRQATANWLTFADIERGSAKLKEEEEE